ncbi:hypothetical protein MBLNU230_g6473t1 [Neophaeotheca triangularis]
MNNTSFSASPKKASLSFTIHEDEQSPSEHQVWANVPLVSPRPCSLNLPSQRSGVLKRNFSAMPLPLGKSKHVNKAVARDREGSEVSKRFHISNSAPSLTLLTPSKKENMEPMEELMAKLAHQQKQLNRTQQMLAARNDDNSSTVTDPFAGTPPTESNTSDGRPDAAEVFKLKKELEIATNRLAQMDLELEQSRITKHTVEQAIGSPFPAAQHLAFNINNLQPTRDNTPFDMSMGGMQASGMADRIGTYNLARPQPPSRLATPFEGFAAQQNFAHRANTGYGQRQGNLAPGFVPQMSSFGGQAPFGMAQTAHYVQPTPVGTRLSPTATEFNVIPQMGDAPPGISPFIQALNANQPLNYRRLLERNMSCNWKFIVDKIVCNNDQQASIFLQQKLKVGTIEQKFDIIQSIIEQAYPLCVNRFGNFLVQRCFEHGTPEQIIAIARAIRGNTLNLSMDAFGCHVVQKAFDYVPEEYKAIMVHELLRRIPETVIHRYACHVWQKLFELRWRDEPPQIMRYVNEALRGMWHEVALGETGSLVVQNIFENCLEEDKRPCINEVLGSIDVVAHGQFGNWCIQHICEHGSNNDRTRALDHILRFATEYSTDQFASKVVEKCLKTAGTDFLDRYLDVICQSRVDRPRMPLIDISSDQYGNYLIQYVLTNADAERREIIASHIRKHMVSLRGSKYGQRVAMLCSNPSMATRPGPVTGFPGSRNAGAFAGVNSLNERFNQGVMGRSLPPVGRHNVGMDGIGGMMGGMGGMGVMGGMAPNMGYPAGFGGPHRG